MDTGVSECPPCSEDLAHAMAATYASPPPSLAKGSAKGAPPTAHFKSAPPPTAAKPKINIPATEDGLCNVDLDVVPLPRGIKLGRTPYGMGVFASRAFKKGDVLYRGTYHLVPDRRGKAKLQVKPHPDDNGEPQEFELDFHVHTVQVENGRRQLYTFDAFMNHSCDPTTYTPVTTQYDDEDGGAYDTVALRDIAEGDQITCDYALFEWDCTDKNIDVCGCGSAICRGSMHGFRHLTPAQQLANLHRACPEVLTVWHKHHPDMRYFNLTGRAGPPPGVAIRYHQASESFSVVATRDFKAGDTLFVNHSALLPDNVDVLYSFESVPDGAVHTKIMDKIWHSVNRGGGMREYYGWDSFCNHSCDPNSESRWESGSLQYAGVALRDINDGEEITCDYSTFDEELDGSVFTCACGAANCRVNIRG